MKPRPTPKKRNRKGPTADQLADLSYRDYLGDCERRERQKTDDYKARVALANLFKKRSR